MGGEVLVSWLATFRPSIGWRAWACGALTSAYVCQGVVVVGPGVVLKVAVRDTGCGVCLVVCGVGVSGLGLLRRRR